MKAQLTRLIIALALPLSLAACSPKAAAPVATASPPPVVSETDSPDLTILPVPTSAVGLQTLSSPLSSAEVKEKLVAALDSNPKASLVHKVSHTENAKTADLSLPPLELFIFGNPEVGTPLIKARPTIAIDLPQKFLVEEKDGKTFLHYNSTAYLALRHGIEIGDFETMTGVLKKLSTGVTQGEEKAMDVGLRDIGQGFLTKDSDQSFDQTVNALREALSSHPKLKLMKEFDHQANAQSVGMETEPSTLFIFGNPAVGSPLMQEHSSVAIDLPQKILVYQEQGQVKLLANDPFYLAKRHILMGQDERLKTVKGALEKLMAVAAGE